MTASDLRAWYPSLAADSTNITDPMLDSYVEGFSDIAERYRGVAYEPRGVTVTRRICGSRWVADHQQITAVTACTVDAVTTAATIEDASTLTFLSTVSGLLVVTYTHGFASPPALILDACREYARSRALAARSSVPRDAVSTTDGGYTIRYSTPDWPKGRPTGFLEVDALLNQVTDYRRPVVV